jgi:hypothetical protein
MPTAILIDESRTGHPLKGMIRIIYQKAPSERMAKKFGQNGILISMISYTGNILHALCMIDIHVILHLLVVSVGITGEMKAMMCENFRLSLYDHIMNRPYISIICTKCLMNSEQARTQKKKIIRSHPHPEPKDRRFQTLRRSTECSKSKDIERNEILC